MKRIGLIMMLVLLSAGCASKYASNGEQNYVYSRNGVDVVVPPPLTDVNISHFYELPQQTQNPKVSIVPPVV